MAHESVNRAIGSVRMLLRIEFMAMSSHFINDRRHQRGERVVHDACARYREADPGWDDTEQHH